MPLNLNAFLVSSTLGNIHLVQDRLSPKITKFRIIIIAHILLLDLVGPKLN